MGGKTNYQDYAVTQGGVGNIVADPVVPTVMATSGATEPAWPTSEYATVVDGEVTWTAVYARVAEGEVLGVLNPAVFQHNLTTYPHHYFQYGVLTWLTGANAGFTVDLRDSYGVATVNGQTSRPYIYTLELMPSPVQVGDTFEVTIGCPKTRYACQEFNNMDNFRGFPDMPTEDRALQTPNIMSQGYATPNTK